MEITIRKAKYGKRTSPFSNNIEKRTFGFFKDKGLVQIDLWAMYIYYWPKNIEHDVEGTLLIEIG